MALNATPMLCPFTIASDIFTLKKDIAKTHCSNVELNVPDNAPLTVYQVALARYWLVMGLKIDNSLVDTRLSKMEATIKNIVSLTAVSNLGVNKVIEREATTTVTTKVTSAKEPKWTGGDQERVLGG
jgi:sporulation-control protein spo0M